MMKDKGFKLSAWRGHREPDFKTVTPDPIRGLL